MNVLLTIVLAVQILAALGMIVLILLQHGKGADMGAAFGSGASGSLFGASGSANFLSRTTAVLAALFFACTLALAYFSHSVKPTGGSSVLEGAVPAAPAAAPASATTASQIPSAVPAPQGVPSAPAAPAPAAAASGAAQIPTK